MQRHGFILLLGILIGTLCASAQNNTSSPYSRFGYGELSDNVPGAYRALGGVGIGMRSNKVINPSQPASFSVVDSTTFMFDVAASAMWTAYADAAGKKNKANGNLEYLTIQFPLWKYIGFSVGILPYSYVGYDFSIQDSTAAYNATKTYVGKGGLTQVYGGLSFNILNWVAVGANIYYMFGETTNIRALTFSQSDIRSVSQTSTLRVNDVHFRYGLQFFHTWGKHNIVLGGIFENRSNLNTKFQQIETTTADTVSTRSDGFQLPMVYGAGVSYTWAERLTLAADYMVTDWQNTLYFGQKDVFRTRSKISLGVQYLHDPLGKKYWEHIPFRIGASVSDSYIKNVATKDFSVSLGLGFPLHNVGTVINTTFEYGHRGTQATLSENYLRFTINASISENWFFKRKL